MFKHGALTGFTLEYEPMTPSNSSVDNATRLIQACITLIQQLDLHRYGGLLLICILAIGLAGVTVAAMTYVICSQRSEQPRSRPSRPR